MPAFRLRCSAVGLLIYIQTATIGVATRRTSESPSSSPSSSSANDAVDVPSRTVLADIVFEGRAHREPRLPGSHGLYTVRFKVLQLYKGRFSEGDGGPEVTPEVVTVGVFGQTDGAKNCSQAAPRVTMESRYIVFLVAKTDDVVASGNDTRLDAASVAKTTDGRDVRTESFYRISGCPEPVTKETSRQVRKHACRTCAQAARVRRVSGGKEITSGQKVQIQCRSSGKPRPEITWYKDGVKLTQSDRISFTHRRQNSQLRIQRSKPTDSGLYQCQASNALGRTELIGTNVVVKRESKPHSEPCPRQDYCLNGGTCYVMPLLKKNFCECSKNYVGLRCEEKFTDQNIQMVLGKEIKRKRSPLKRRRF